LAKWRIGLVVSGVAQMPDSTIKTGAELGYISLSFDYFFGLSNG